MFRSIWYYEVRGVQLIVLTTLIPILLLFQGCEDLALDAPEDAEEAAELTNVNNERWSENPKVHRATRHYRYFASEIPKFGGLFFENRGETLVLQVTDKSEVKEQKIANKARNYISQEAMNLVKGVRRGIDEIDVDIRNAEFKYSKLVKWFDNVHNEIIRAEGVTLASISQRDNQLRVGIIQDKYKQNIHDILQEKNVPEEAVKIDITGEIKKDISSSTSSSNTLRDKVRPLVGGLEINGYEDVGGQQVAGTCTFSFNIYWQNKRHWITNSHCTKQRWDENPDDDYYQSSLLDGSDAKIGYEVFDPSGYNFCGPYAHCRDSDAAILKLQDDVNWNFGKIARTTQAAGPGEGSGSIEIEENNPYFTITDDRDEADFVTGIPVEKVGRTTGWTYGEIVDDCATIVFDDDDLTYPGGYSYLCQKLTNYHALGGDSGSPVFTIENSSSGNVIINGVHWGRLIGGDQERIFSPIYGVYNDLEAGDEIIVVDGEEPTPRSPSVFGSMDGCNPRISWGATSITDEYEVQRKFDWSGVWTTQIHTSETSYTDTGVCDSDLEVLFSGGDVEVSYRVRAIGYEGQKSTFSNTVDFGEEDDNNGPIK